ncbi:hypothetical protein [Herbidospora sp. NBRC 101105]|uniref:hypothetical protein n=1 Tax=Herbidospora sp. NBRC 101105 TaxID=3032195 RepID=UPI0025533DBE|nr:hypothetical protein [Herbidospora sp. NBRC 101105]
MSTVHPCSRGGHQVAGSGLTFQCWREEGLLTLADLLTSLGSMVEGYRWRLVIDELFSPRYQEITEAAEIFLMSTEQLVAMFGDDAQLIDGELTAHNADESTADLTIRALDSTWWDVETTIQEVLDEILRLYPDAEALPLRSP